MIALQLAAGTDRGRVRDRNEDSVAVDEALGAAALADGMGGLRDGHVASREAVAAALDQLRVLSGRGGQSWADYGEPAVLAAVRAANDRVWSLARGAMVMGTTLEVLRADPRGGCQLAHVGDSRAYRLPQGGRLELLTRDHSMVQDLVDRGVLRPEQARRSLNRNVITRAVGLAEDLDPDCLSLELGVGDLLLLCSDGLWDMLEDAQIERLLRACRPESEALQACADQLLAAANAAGGMDNVSVVLARRGAVAAGG